MKNQSENQFDPNGLLVFCLGTCALLWALDGFPSFWELIETVRSQKRGWIFSLAPLTGIAFIFYWTLTMFLPKKNPEKIVHNEVDITTNGVSETLIKKEMCEN